MIATDRVAEYAMIGDRRTGALVRRDGTIAWATDAGSARVLERVRDEIDRAGYGSEELDASVLLLGILRFCAHAGFIDAACALAAVEPG